jgi:hypothetical protein
MNGKKDQSTNCTPIRFYCSVRVLLLNIFMTKQCPGREESMIKERCPTEVLDRLLVFSP